MDLAAHAARRTSARIVESVQEYACHGCRGMAVRCSRTCIWAAWPKLELNGTAVELDVTANLPWQRRWQGGLRLGGDVLAPQLRLPARFTLAFRLPVGWAVSPAAAPITATGESESGADSSA